MIELLGIVLVIQGVGGFIKRVADSDSDSWYVQLHLLPDALQLPASVTMAVAGLVLATIGASQRKKKAGR